MTQDMQEKPLNLRGIRDYHDMLMEDLDLRHDIASKTLWIGEHYEAVDLGLPSGTLWADMNVGALSPEEPGSYFSWGNIIGHNAGDGYSFYEAVYNGTGGGGYGYGYGYGYGGDSEPTPGSLLSDDIPSHERWDAARANMGGRWRMPTREQCEELMNSNRTVREWTTGYNGVPGANGYLIRSKLTGGSIFLPAAGYGCEGTFYYVGSEGFYWSSSIFTDGRTYARNLHFGRGGSFLQSATRHFGLPVRAVQ